MHIPIPAQSRPTCELDAAAIASFQRDGYVRIGAIVSPDELEAVRADEAYLRSTLCPGDSNRSTHFWSLVNKHCPGVRRLAVNGPQIEAVSRLLGPDVALWWNQFVTKMPNPEAVSGEFPWHQDNGYADVAPGNNLTVWIALDDVDEVNGCVWIIPGSHAQGLLPHQRPSAESWHLSTVVSSAGVPVPMRAGEAVLFSGYTLHRSLANRSPHPRRALFCQYAHADAVMVGKDNARVSEHPDGWIVRGRARFIPPATP